jgi:acetyl-CoA acyltransferase
MEIRTVGILDIARSPISKAKGGALLGMPGLDIATQVLKQLLARNPKLKLSQVEMITCGCAFPEGENGLNVARLIGVKAGLPIETAAITVNQFCASSQQALMMVADAIAVGKGDVGVVVGFEHMVRVPMGGFNPYYDKELYEQGFYLGMGDTAELLAKEGDITRAAQEQFAVDSHHKALKAWADKAFNREVVPIKLPNGQIFDRDECPMEPNLEKMKKLGPAFDANGTITAATASPVSIGAAAAIVISADLAKKLEMPLRARIVTTAVSGCDPRRMGMGPLPATEKALARAGL